MSSRSGRRRYKPRPRSTQAPDNSVEAPPNPAPPVSMDEGVLLSPPVGVNQQPSVILRDLEQEALVLRNLRNQITEQLSKLQFEAFVLSSLETKVREQEEQPPQPPR